MSPPHFNPRADLSDELLRVIRAEAMQAARDAAGPGTVVARVHNARTACKRIRAALRLLRSLAPATYHRENAWFRDAARKFSAVRGADVQLDTLDALLEGRSAQAGHRRRQTIRRRLIALRRKTRQDALTLEAGLAHFAVRMRAAAARLARVRVKGRDFGVIAPGFTATYRRARRAFRDADPEKGGREVHRWRKEAKAHGEHLRLLQAAWPRVLKKMCREISDLTELLGAQHDLDGLQDFLEAEGILANPTGPADPLRALIAARRKELGRAAVLPGRRVFADKPKVFQQRLERWWSAAARAGVAAPTADARHLRNPKTTQRRKS